MLKVEINGQQFEAEPGSTIIEVADSAGIYIPRFCYHEKLSVAANCRMCLVEVEKAPKPLPACATPVTDGMVVQTLSEIAKQAQEDTMEFLLINHPLDCPICDQGGECPLQDQAIGFGGSSSVFKEVKRSVDNVDLGPLITTEMTRCIHCTRCVRFGEEVAGVMELGAIGRGEDMKISTFLGTSMDSEVSGNVIDLCPVGALTSKPYRFTARTWELNGHKGISPHDCLGSNLEIQEIGGVVKRVLPRDNEAVNECWLSDRDRYSYESVNCNDRLTMPLVRRGENYQEIEWAEALDLVSSELGQIKETWSGEQIGAMVSPTSSLEEFFLLQKILRALGSSNVDHRLRQQDFRDDLAAPVCPGTEMPISKFQELDGVLIVGSNIRKELPLISLRLRRLAQQGGEIAVLNPMSFNHNFTTAQEVIVKPSMMAIVFASIARKVATATGKADLLPRRLVELATRHEFGTDVDAIADCLTGDDSDVLILLGQIAMNHPDASMLRQIASWMGENCGIRIALLPDANGVAGWVAGCVPHRLPGGRSNASPGLNSKKMIDERLKAYVLYGVEVSNDYADPVALDTALNEAEFVVSFSTFRSAVPMQADVVFPLAAFTEIDAGYINCEGVTQFASAAVKPMGQSRPGWKILRVLGNFLKLDGFDQVTSKDIITELEEVYDLSEPISVRYKPDLQAINHVFAQPAELKNGKQLDRIIDVPVYSVDPTVRRATALQSTKDADTVALLACVEELEEMGFKPGGRLAVHSKAGKVMLPVQPDDRVPRGAVYVPTGLSETSVLGSFPVVVVQVME
jgi:NADH-quinone oxidoreductase subunit G|tara:strand:+ start:715 stop:3114 length:2400 start_codon:yes stop_codon:yes gene_type:complete